MYDTDHILVFGTEQSCVVSFLDHDECDARLVVILQFHTRLSHTAQFVLQDLGGGGGGREGGREGER